MVQEKFLYSRSCHQKESVGSGLPQHSLADLSDEPKHVPGKVVELIILSEITWHAQGASGPVTMGS